MSQLVIETSTGWMIRCRTCQWHEFPKKKKPGASWTFNGDVFKPTFTPSMNELVKFSEAALPEDRRPDRRCHFIVTGGSIKYCNDCTHELKGQTLPLEPWSETEVKYHALLLEEHKQKAKEPT